MQDDEQFSLWKDYEKCETAKRHQDWNTWKEKRETTSFSIRTKLSRNEMILRKSANEMNEAKVTIPSAWFDQLWISAR